ncbi:MAG: CoA ester lyase [Firmicutes bacterium HGW-Firmicutes-11]|jgi:citrate lyase subunit beta/citryl-CoA lyase|nr:MAG: CoA ester lyase [Firmicutes bacterium HGW-Firmicutes-11]
MKVIRSSLYIPANNPIFVDKCAKYPADNITFDIEDAVPPQEKDNARKMAAANLIQAGSNGAEVYVRVNGWHTEYTNDDLEAVVLPGLAGITLPKTRNVDDVKRLDWKISELEERRGIPAGTVKIAVLLETAEGIMNAYPICTASPRIVAAFFGAVDYCADMRINRTNEAPEQMVARTIVAIAARAAGIVALDAPFADYSNMDAFRKNTLDGRQMGFEGRMLINPSQVAVAHELYSPTPEELAHAEVIKKFFEEEGLAKGLAAVSLDGKMVDTPVYVSALNTLEFYDAIQKQENRSKTK